MDSCFGVCEVLWTYISPYAHRYLNTVIVPLWHLHPSKSPLTIFQTRVFIPACINAFEVQHLNWPGHHPTFTVMCCNWVLRGGMEGEKKNNHKYCSLNCWKQSPASLAGIYKFFILTFCLLHFFSLLSATMSISAAAQWSRELMWLKKDLVVLSPMLTADISKVFLGTYNLNRWSREIRCIFERDMYNADLSAVQEHYWHKL